MRPGSRAPKPRPVSARCPTTTPAASARSAPPARPPPTRPPPCSVAAIGAADVTAANALAPEADVVLGVGTRWSDCTPASRSLLAPATSFVNLNVAPVDAFKPAGLPLIADARAGIEQLTAA